MIFVFKSRYSGWPVDGEWIAVTERHEIPWEEPCVEELIDDVTSAGDNDAALASGNLSRRCHCFGGDTPEDAMRALLADEGAMISVNE